MRHAKTFVMASLPPATTAETAEAVSDQKSAVSGQKPLVQIELPPPPTPDGSPPTPDLQSGRETDALFDALVEPLRRRLLVTLCATGGAYVSTLCARLGMDQKSVSRHLGHLRVRGLVVNRREGQHVWYGPNPNLVRYETRDGRYTLTVIHPSGEGLAVFGKVEGGMGTTTAVAATTAEGSGTG